MKKEIFLHLVIIMIVLLTFAGCARKCYIGKDYLPQFSSETEMITEQTLTYPVYDLFEMNSLFFEPGHMIDIIWYMWIHHPDDYSESIQALFIGPVF